MLNEKVLNILNHIFPVSIECFPIFPLRHAQKHDKSPHTANTGDVKPTSRDCSPLTCSPRPGPPHGLVASRPQQQQDGSSSRTGYTPGRATQGSELPDTPARGPPPRFGETPADTDGGPEPWALSGDPPRHSHQLQDPSLTMRLHLRAIRHPRKTYCKRQKF